MVIPCPRCRHSVVVREPFQTLHVTPPSFIVDGITVHDCRRVWLADAARLRSEAVELQQRAARAHVPRPRPAATG